MSPADPKELTFADEASDPGHTETSPSSSSSREPLRMSSVSRRYDRDGKGFLDETEQALRRMDSQNMGTLGVDKVYSIMESLQAEQKRSAVLMEHIHGEHQKTMSLKKGLIALSCFTVLLALSNVGTSFAAARLAKDTTVSGPVFVESGSGAMLATESRVNEIVVEPIDPTTDRRRLLRELRNVNSICDGSMANVTCTIQGKLKREHAANLHSEFCPNFAVRKTCSGISSKSVMLNCNGVKTTVHPGSAFSSGRKPEYVDGRSGFRELHFPHKVDEFNPGYVGSQPVSVAGQLDECLQIFHFSIVCPQDPSYQQECLLFAAFIRTCGEASICGPNAEYVDVN